jgi:hypothetical protein
MWWIAWGAHLLIAVFCFQPTMLTQTRSRRRTRPPERDQYDNPLKEAIQHLLHRLLEWYFISAFQEIDWSVPPEFLETELRQIAPSSESGQRRADKLAKVRLKSGEYEFVLIHVELEGDPEPDFDERMYVYNYRSYDLFRKPVASFAVLADAVKSRKAGTFTYSILGTTVALGYSVAKMVEYQDRLEELEKSDNPFALITLAQLQTQATRRKPESRLEWKARITERLYERGMNREEIQVTFRVIDWMMQLPGALDRSFQERVEQIEARYKMPYVTSIERIARKDGLQEGRLQERREMVLTLLREKFSNLPASLLERMAAVSDMERLMALFQAAVRASSMEEFEHQL